MKRILLLLMLFSLVSCEEVVDVELEESAPRLVVEASLLWNTDLQDNVQVIKLTTTAPYFNESVPAAIGATVTVNTETGEEFLFTEVSDGIFTNEEMPPVLDVKHELVITYKDEIYVATEELIPVPKLNFVEQSKGGFSGDDTEFKIFYRDPAEVENYYLFRYINEKISLQIYDDEFTNGNQTFAFFSDEDAEPGDLVAFQIQGISEGFYEYMYILRSQSGTAGGPFQTQPSIVRGNIVNTTNPGNFPFGYFRMSETNILPYEVE